MSRKGTGLPVQFVIVHGDRWVVDVEAGRRTYKLGTFDTCAECVERLERWTADRGLELQSVILLAAERPYQRR